jgi:dienelactone hydrolase
MRTAFEQEMTAGGVDWQLHLYGGVGHAFTRPAAGSLGMPGFAYSKSADERSWQSMLGLFGETLGPP